MLAGLAAVTANVMDGCRMGEHTRQPNIQEASAEPSHNGRADGRPQFQRPSRDRRLPPSDGRGREAAAALLSSQRPVSRDLEASAVAPPS